MLDVNVSKVPAKPKRRGMHVGTRPGWKKAVVTDGRGRDHRSIRTGVSEWPFAEFKPTSPGRRFMSVSDFAEVTKDEPEKSLLAPVSKKGGRNNNGRITTRHQGGGHKRRYRMIDFKRTKDGVPGQGALDRVRPQPLGADRPAALRRRREALHPGARCG